MLDILRKLGAVWFRLWLWLQSWLI